MLFEFLTLEGAQAGLSWQTILNKRENYQVLFERFDPEVIAAYDQERVEELLQDPGIVRNRLKVESTVSNAAAVLELQREHGSLDAYFWDWVNGSPVVGEWESLDDLPVTTALAESMSKDLKERGFRFVGPTIVYSFLQATGLVNDHITKCYRFAELTT